MTRRAHRKSRKGCLQCKQRHIKCDETYPSCLHCINADRRCSFLSDPPPSTTSPRVSASSSRLQASIPSPTDTDATTGISPRLPHPIQEGVVNMVHLDLLNHARTVFSRQGFGLDPRQAENVSEAVMQYALASPYLMHEVLALAASHLSTVRPTLQSFFRNQATELQTSALSLFNGEIDDNSTSNCATRFLFASLLGMQVLHETLSFRTEDFGLFLDKFVGYLRLTRGVNLQIDGNWQLLHETGLRPLLLAGSRLPPEGSASASECDELERLIRSADVGPSSMQAYLQAIDRLKALFQVQKSTIAEDVDSSTSLLFSWPVTVPSEYADLVMQRRPEALAILAHYGALLHHHRELWIVGDGGRYLIESITAYLGTYWKPWLAYPNSLLDDASPILGFHTEYSTPRSLG